MGTKLSTSFWPVLFLVVRHCTRQSTYIQSAAWINNCITVRKHQLPRSNWIQKTRSPAITNSVRPSNTLCNSTWKYLQTFTNGDSVELFNSLPTETVLRTFMHYSITFCSRLEAASDVISGAFMRQHIVHKAVKFVDHWLNSSREI